MRFVDDKIPLMAADASEGSKKKKRKHKHQKGKRLLVSLSAGMPCCETFGSIVYPLVCPASLLWYNKLHWISLC